MRQTAPLLATSIAEQLHDVLQQRITSGAMAPGSRIDLSAVAEEFGVSRTPVRDALVRLEIERLVKTSPRSGTFVATPTRWDVREVCQVRKGFEWVATGIAAESMSLDLVAELKAEAEAALKRAQEGDFLPFYESDTRIHGEILKSTENARLIDARATVEPFTYWLRVLGATGSHRIAGSTERHLHILDAIAARDVAEAQHHAAQHLDEIETWTVEDISRNLIRLES